LSESGKGWSKKCAKSTKKKNLSSSRENYKKDSFLHFFVVLVGDFLPPVPFPLGVSVATLFTFVAAAACARAGKVPFPVSLPALACVDWIREALFVVIGFFGVGLFLLAMTIYSNNKKGYTGA
jgi:hypothetical protein